MRKWLWICALAMPACGSDDHGNGHDEDPAQHACEQVNELGTAVTAGDTRANAPLIAPSEQPYTVTLVAGESSFLQISGGTDAVLFSKATGAVIGLFHEQSVDNLLPSPLPNQSCPTEIPEHFDLALDQGGSYYLELAPAAISSIWLALTDAGGHAD
jgi:hypothetical protein